MYSIYSKVLEKSKIASVSDLRIMEAYFKGLKIDYTVVYPSGNEMQVKFVAKPKSVLIQIQDTRADIDRLIKQSDYLEADTKTANADKRVLRQHYANTKAALKTKLDTLLNQIEVNSPIHVTANSADSAVDSYLKAQAAKIKYHNNTTTVQ